MNVALAKINRLQEHKSFLFSFNITELEQF